MIPPTEYLTEDIVDSFLRIKVLKIIGYLEFNEHEVVKKISMTVQEFLRTHKDVDYLIAYYYPTQEDLTLDAALCVLDLVDVEIRNFDASAAVILLKKIRWNEDYGLFSTNDHGGRSYDIRLVKDTYTLLQTAEEASDLLFELRMCAERKTPFSNDVYQRLENWIFKAKHASKGYGELEHIIQDEVISLVRHFSTILYCCISDIGKNISTENERQRILHYELENASDKYTVLHHQLVYLLRNILIRKNA
jgi:hypothetical protein